MFNENCWIVDSEGDGLKPTKLHVLSAKRVEGGKVYSTPDYDKMKKLLTGAEFIIGHNMKRFDVPVFERILGTTRKNLWQ